jgi:hypothetical protein
MRKAILIRLARLLWKISAKLDCVAVRMFVRTL